MKPDSPLRDTPSFQFIDRIAAQVHEDFVATRKKKGELSHRDLETLSRPFAEQTEEYKDVVRLQVAETVQAMSRLGVTLTFEP